MFDIVDRGGGDDVDSDDAGVWVFRFADYFAFERECVVGEVGDVRECLVVLYVMGGFVVHDADDEHVVDSEFRLHLAVKLAYGLVF